MSLTLFLAGDVMTGRGVDQILPHSVDPHLYEPWAKSARRYVELAEAENGRIPAPVEPSWVWGDALEELERVSPDARVINLETAVTTSEDYWPGKGIHYRMHPENVSVLTAAGIDCCVLANNHVMDWGVAGLDETLRTLRGVAVATAGAGEDRAAARTPAVLYQPGGRRVLVFAYALETSGVPETWAAGPDRPGVSLLEDLSPGSLKAVAEEVAAVRRPGDLVVLSLHWGPNWGYHVTREERAFAHGLVDEAGAHVIFGHSSHHPKGVEVYRDRVVLYGCGDFLNDYEGIGGKESFRGDLVVMYLPTFDGTDPTLASLRLVPFRIRRFRLGRPTSEDVAWIQARLDRESRKLDTGVSRGEGGALQAYRLRKST